LGREGWGYPIYTNLTSEYKCYKIPLLLKNRPKGGKTSVELEGTA
jgi:hypothetical protein